ncbi:MULTISPECIES: hypothetical protein [unclassified Rhizobium]|uniref:hypothetical protein n=1 Tax=unclassified Rhizobium TaxID=2613769 RepID=UPI0038252E07
MLREGDSRLIAEAAGTVKIHLLKAAINFSSPLANRNPQLKELQLLPSRSVCKAGKCSNFGPSNATGSGQQQLLYS